jgi:formylglycine-generating enzyme required for sulfatase activity
MKKITKNCMGRKFSPFAFCLLLFAFCLLLSCGKDKVTGVTLSPDTLALAPNETATLTATVLPDNASNKKVSWSSSNPTVVIVENGVVTAKSAGSAEIIVTTKDGNFTATCPVIVHSAAPQMATVEGGTFTMGCTDNECYDWEKPSHQVTLNSYKIDVCPITQKQWVAIMGNNPSYFKGDDLPVESVSWNDVQEFIKKLNEATGHHYRLPTEAEWEYACRGGSQTAQYKYSGSSNINEVAWYKENSGNKTHPVGTKAANELGIYDMSGNVWEWCSDWYEVYTATAQTNPTGPATGTLKVIRGGSWGNEAQRCRASNRGTADPELGQSALGFRLVLQ